MNKKRRQELNQLKFIKRLKQAVASCHIYVNREGEYVRNPIVQDVLDDNGMLYYKTTSTPCSCWMCSGEYKYKRHEQKKETRRLINEYYMEGKWGVP